MTVSLWLALLLSQTCSAEERSKIRTLTDFESSRVYFVPQKATVAQLRKLTGPPYSESRPRNVTEEETVYELSAYVLALKSSGGTLSALIVDRPDALKEVTTVGQTGSQDTLEIEFPAPECTAGSIQKVAMDEARQNFIRAIGKPAAHGKVTRLRKPIRLLIQGVGFFGQPGKGPLNTDSTFELVPILKVDASNKR